MRIELPANITWIIERLESCGFEGYAVGGCVRDSLLGREIHDWDIASSAAPEQLRGCFPGETLIPTGERHGTMTLIADGEPVEITTFRIDCGYSDGRRPDGVCFARRIGDDLARRDFTINAMAYSPRAGILDLFGGRNDIGARVLRCVGEPEKRFEEDALRMLRAFRFYAKLQATDGRRFAIEPETLAAIKRCAPGIGRVSAERINAELCGILLSERAYETLRLMTECGIWRSVRGIERDILPPEGLDAAPQEVAARMAALLAGYGVDAAAEMAAALRFRNADIARIRGLISGFSADISEDYALLSLANRLGAADARTLLDTRAALGEGAVSEACRRFEALMDSGRCWSLDKLAVNGGDMAELGFRGRRIGAVLRLLLNEVMRGAPNEREYLINLAIKLKAP